MTETTQRIVEVLRSIPRGRVTTYRGVAAAAGLRNGARQVARVLHSMAEREQLPWHRVVRADGSIALPWGAGRELQQALLCDEGVTVSEEGIVDLSVYGTFDIIE